MLAGDSREISMAKAKKKKVAKIAKAAKSNAVKRKTAKRKASSSKVEVMALPFCSSDVCAQYHDLIEEVCHHNGWPPGHQVIVRTDNQFCICTCR
jgi:hypothetical protein